MKKALLLLLMLCLAAQTADAQRRRKKIKEDRTERGLVYRVLGALRDKDAHSYVQLFPDLDTFATLVMEQVDSNSGKFYEMMALQENATQLLRRDSLVSARLAARFDSLIRRGEAIGIDWKSTVPLRYELFQKSKTRDTLLEKLMPERFVGYAFFMDMSSRQTYCVTLSDLFKLKGRWYGGQLGNLFAAKSVDEYLAAARQNQRGFGSPYFIFIPQGKFDPEEKKADTPIAQKPRSYSQVVTPDAPEDGLVLERKYYKGFFDEEIPVQLYIRYLKGNCDTPPCLFEAIYLFGQELDYITLQVTKEADGTWVFTDPKSGATMELTLEGKTYTGDWLLDMSQNGYDVEMKEVDSSPVTLQKLDGVVKRLKNN